MAKRKSKPVTARVELYRDECIAAASGLLRDAAEQVAHLGLTLGQVSEGDLANQIADVQQALARARLLHSQAQRLEDLND